MTGNIKKIFFVIIFIIITLLISLIINFVTSDFNIELSDNVNVALIKINGPIMYGENGGIFSGDQRDAAAISKEINSASEDESIDVILLDINSPGGTVVASKEISNAVKRSDKLVISLIKEVGASGAYWIASQSDYIIADSMSITGSIGVIASYLEFGGLLDEYGISYEKMIGGKYKDMGSPFRNLTLEERNLFQSKIDQIHEEFKFAVMKNRNLTQEEIDELGQGQFFLGIEAKENKLIDELGDKYLFEELLKKKYNVTEIKYTQFEKEMTLIDAFFGKVESSFYNVGQGIADSFKTEQRLKIK